VNCVDDILMFPAGCLLESVCLKNSGLFYHTCCILVSEGSEDELIEFPVYRSTECARVGSQIYVITIETETLFLKFKDDQG
jgi:hypothetical protein